MRYSLNSYKMLCLMFSTYPYGVSHSSILTGLAQKRVLRKKMFSVSNFPLVMMQCIPLLHHSWCPRYFQETCFWKKKKNKVDPIRATRRFLTRKCFNDFGANIVINLFEFGLSMMFLQLWNHDHKSIHLFLW